MAKRILIADDSVTIQKAFAMTLAPEDLTLTPARSADEGLTLARQTHPDLVIADATMPGRSGYELCAAIKADAALRGTTVLILASSQQPYDEAKGTQVGADGHLIKPWDTNALVERLNDVLAHGPSASASMATAPVARPAPVLTPAPVAGRAASSMPAAVLEDEYGEISVVEPRDTAVRPTLPSYAAPAPAVAPPAAPAPAAPPPAAAPAYAAPAYAAHTPAASLRTTSQGLSAAPAPAAAPAGMRPSMIPGVRPGMMPPARPGTVPARTLGPGASSAPGAVPPRPSASPIISRTMIGLPAATGAPMPGSMRPMAPVAPSPPPRSPTGPLAPLGARPLAPSPAMSSAVSSAVDHKVAAFAARGPEYEAIAKLSREVIEQIVWEVVPELAEIIIREHVEKRGRS